MTRKFSECVSPGHPDKCADYISEYILDRYLEQDPNVRYAVEVMIKGNTVYLAGEVTSTVTFDWYDYRDFVYEALGEIGYTEEYLKEWGKENVFDRSDMEVFVNISAQSPEISQGVDNDGYGDQGIFFGYADVNGDEYLMPKSHTLAKSLCYVLYTQAKEEGIGGLDIKTEIVLNENDSINKIIAAVPCRSDEEYNKVLERIKLWYWDAKLYFRGDENTGELPEIILNGTGNYVMHGPIADCGVTGRKLAVDFYGGEFQVGGGATSSKDGTKADVSLNLYARKLAKQWALKTGQSIKVALACCIGRSEVDYSIETPRGDVIETGVMDLKPSKVIKELGLDSPIYSSMHQFGLFGEFQQDKNWEKID